MSRIFTNGNRIRGDNATAAGIIATDFPVYQQFLKGADIASGSTLGPLGIEDYFHVTGTTTISFISTSGLLTGKRFDLRFTSALTLNNNAASPPGGTAPMLLLAGANVAVGVGGVVAFRYDSALAAFVQISGAGPSVAVASVTAGPGISVTGTSTNPVINNTGVISVTAGPGISVTGTGANPVINNTGVLSVVAGTNITVTGTAQNPVVNNNGVLSVGHGLGISITGTANNPVVNNTGILALSVGPGITNSGVSTAPLLSANVIGSHQYGGFVTALASSRVWIDQGQQSGGSAIPVEWPIVLFMSAGATKIRWEAVLGAWSGPDAVASLSCGGTILAGGITIGSSFVGGYYGPIDVVIPSGVGPQKVGLTILPTGSSQGQLLVTAMFF